MNSKNNIEIINTNNHIEDIHGEISVKQYQKFQIVLLKLVGKKFIH